jgi:hypothetical protein
MNLARPAKSDCGPLNWILIGWKPASSKITTFEFVKLPQTVL